MFRTISRHSTSQRFRMCFLAFLLAFAGLAGSMARAQISGTGAISGTVQDPTGAVIANATVIATNVDTNVQTVRPTTKAGDYNITPLIPGTYTVTVAAQGFEGYKQENVVVDALVTVGLNVKLTVGRADETVTITAAPPLLSTTDATLGAVMDNEMYSSLPIQMGQGGNSDQRRATDFEYLMPGVQNNYTSNNSTDNSGIVNGSGPTGGVSEIYIEGVNLPEGDQVGDPRFTWTTIGVDAVNQFQVQTAGVSSQYAGEGVENYSIKSGGNAIHGSIYEYMRNTVLDAWAFTNKIPTVTGVLPAGASCTAASAPSSFCAPGGVKPKEIQNEFGIVISGPIIKNKLFLFGNYGQYRNQNGAKVSAVTLPTAAMLGMTTTGTPLPYADFSGYAAANPGYHIYDPSTQSTQCVGATGNTATCTRTEFDDIGANGTPTLDNISSARFSAPALNINKFYAPYEGLVNQSLYSNNLSFGTPTGLANWYSTGRIDYNENARNQIAAIIAFGRQSTTGPNETSGLTPPFNVSQSFHPVSNIAILKDTFTINSHLINQFAVGYGRYDSLSATINQSPQYAATTLGLVGTPAGQASQNFPALTYSGGKDAPGTQGGYSANVKINNTYTVTDNVQWVFGKHNLTFGGQEVDSQFSIYAALSGGTSPTAYTLNATSTEALTSGTTFNGSTGSPIASYLLGAVSTESLADVFVPGFKSVWSNPSFWGQDDYKVTNKLTLNLGLRWDIFPSIREAHDIFSYLNPTGVNSVTGNLGTYEFTGSGSTAGLYSNTNSPSPIYWKNLGPRIGMAYSVDPKTVIRGSYTVNYARGDWTGGSQKGTPNSVGLTPSGTAPPLVGVSGTPQIYWDNTACNIGKADGVPCGFNLNVAAPTPPVSTITPSVTAGATLAEFNTGESVNVPAGGAAYYWDKHTGSRTPEYINWTFGIQRQITRDMSLTVSYVGSQGHFVSGGFDAPSHHNALTENFAALAGENLSGGVITPCSGVTPGCPTPLLTAAATAANITLAESFLNIQPPNGFGNAQVYSSTSNKVYQYFEQFPQYSSVSDGTNFNGNTAFHALEVSLRERLAHGVDFMLNYTYSKSIDDVGTFRVNDNARLDRSLSVTDQPQNLTATAVYLSPFGKGKIGGNNFLVRAVGSGWALSSIVVYHSGNPVAFTASGCASSAILGTCMPSPVTGQAARTISYNNPPGGITAANFASIVHLNPAAFNVNITGTSTATCQCTSVGLGTAGFVPGTAARVGADNVFGMGFYDVDFGLKRTFPIWEQWKFQLEADLLNSTNHVVWNSPNGGVNGSTYGEITGVNNSPRDVQVSGRISW